LNWKVTQIDQTEYRAWAKAQFSGSLCVDELHLGHRILLTATDPIRDITIGFALVSCNDSEHMLSFLNDLKTQGFQPKVVISDGSPLYPAVLPIVWPKAKHQLCVFHLIKEINEDILAAVRRIRKETFRSAKSKKRKRGRPTKAEAKALERQKQLNERAKFIWEHRYLIVKSPEKMTEEDRANLATMLSWVHDLKLLRAFALEVRAVLDGTISRRQAWYRWKKLQHNPKYQNDEDLQRALKKLRREKFAKAIEYLDWIHPIKIRTNNHVERMNRVVRLKEKVRYGWRSNRSVVRFLVLSLDKMRKEQSEKPPAPTKCLKRRGNHAKSKE
jgi:transposase-like protein